MFLFRLKVTVKFGKKPVPASWKKIIREFETINIILRGRIKAFLVLNIGEYFVFSEYLLVLYTTF